MYEWEGMNRSRKRLEWDVRTRKVRNRAVKCVKLNVFRARNSVQMKIQGTTDGRSPTAKSARCMTWERMK